jgi:outer membrane protein assembly factor BamB
MNAILLLAFLATDYTQDWPQWRGLYRDGIVRGVAPPQTWPKNLKLAWKVQVGEGYSSPVVWGTGVFVHSRDGDNELVSRLNLMNGKAEWKKSYPAAFQKNSYAQKMSRGPFATPVLTVDRLYTFGVTAILSCWNSKTGDLIWRKDFSKQQDTSKLFTGTAMSPLLDSGAVIVHIGDDRGGRVVAFEAATGNERWTWEGDGPGYASPIMVQTGGVKQIVTLTDKSAISLNAANGRLLWSIPLKDEWNENVVTPLVYKDTLILSGVRKGTFAVRLGSAKAPETVWTNTDVAFYLSSPVLEGDYLYGLSSKKRGQMVCVDARTGKIVWATEGRDANQAAVQLLGDQLLFLTDAGDLIVARKSPQKFEQITRYTVAESATWAQPVILNNQILVKDENHLAAWQVR